jgi:hypothetical protein
MLLQGFPRFLHAAKEHQSPNPEDDLGTKLAIAGFSSVRGGAEDWGINHFDFIQRHRREDYSLERLADEGEGAPGYVYFACLALGYLLGQYQADAIDDVEFSRGEALLAGFLALYDEEVRALPT